MDDEGSSNEFPGVQGMPRNVDVQDAAGQQLLADGGGIGLAPSTVNPAASAPSQGLGSNPQQGMVNYCFGWIENVELTLHSAPI